MIAVDHGYWLPSTDFRFRQTELRSPSLLVIRRRVQNARFSDHLFELSSRRPAPWPRVRLLLEGHAIATIGGRETRLGPGDAVIADRWDAAPWTADSDTTDTIYVGWPDGSAGVTETRAARQIPRVVAAAKRLAETMRPGTPRAATRHDTQDLLRGLEAEGILPHAARFDDDCALVTPSFSRFADALGSVLSRTHDWPMAVDVASALALGERQVTRLAAEYFRALYVSVDSLGAYLTKSRMWLVTAAMTSLGARTEEVARHFGFSSPVAMCHAFTAADLPSPGSFRQALIDRIR